jgi:hypothetical protein
LEHLSLVPVAQETAGREIMKKIIDSALIAAAFVAISATTSMAQGPIQDRFCLQGRPWGYPGNCQFSSYRQCMATASGTFATCGLNPRYAYARQPRW